MGKRIIRLGNTEIKKWKCHHRKNLILLEDLDIDKTQVCSMTSSGEKNYKYFIGCKDDDHKIKSLC